MNGDREIADFIKDGFMGLFSSGHTSAPLGKWNPPCWYTQVNDKEDASIDYPVTDEEISTGLWGLKPFKAPDPDGLHAGFFQRFWLVMGNSMKKEVKSIFNSRIISRYMNKTLITLIPKCKNLESLNNYRPITLCNTIYKVVTKIIIERIRPLLQKLISPLQSAFVPGRKGVDNAIIVQELIHTMSKKKGRGGGGVVIKLDLEKAYD